MNKLPEETFNLLSLVLKSAHTCGVESIVLDSTLIRGQSEDINSGIFMLESQPIQLPFSGVGIGRVDVLVNRLNMIDTLPDVFYETKELDNENLIVTKLHLHYPKTKIEYNCCDPSFIRSPKKVNDTFAYSFTIQNDTLRLMSKAFSAMNLKHISFSSDKDQSVHFRATDESGDSLDHIVSDNYSLSPDAATDHFFFKYSIKLLLPLFKSALTNNGISLSISNRGFMRFKINGIHCYILGEV